MTIYAVQRSLILLNIHILNLYFQVAPYTTCLVNGLYWEAPAPRVLSDEDAVKMFGKGSQAENNIGRGIPQIPHKMLAIADITCDIGVSL